MNETSDQNALHNQNNQNAWEGRQGELPKQSDRPVMPISFRMVGDMGPLFKAKAVARLDFKPIVKNRTVKVQPQNSPAYSFDYATLDSVRESCDTALASNGLDIFHAVVDAEDARELHTFLTHESGAFLECVIVLPSHKTLKDGTRVQLTIQETGSAMTYWERYSYVALGGVASEHDDDGNAADGNTLQHSQARDRSRPPAPPQRPQQSAPAAATPRKPPQAAQESPKSAKAPEPEPPAQTAMQGNLEAATELLATADKVAELKADFVALHFKGTPAKELVSILSGGKEHAHLTSPDCDAISSVLQVALARNWNADQLMSLIREDGMGNAEAAIKAINAESDILGGGS